MSIARIAHEAGVSNATVSYVINNKGGVSPETADRVRQAMNKLNYIPRSARRIESIGHASIKTLMIGLVFPDEEYKIYSNPFYSRLIHQIDSELAKRAGVSLLVNLDELQGLSKGNIKLDGTINIGVEQGVPAASDIPSVTLLSHAAYEDRLRADHIEPDNSRVGAMAARYLLGRGHRHVAFFHPHKKSHMATHIRRLAFAGYVASNNVRMTSFEYLFYDRKRDGSGMLYEYEELPALQAFMDDFVAVKDRPTAMFIPSDSHMALFHNAFVRHGIRPGRDIELMGCNNEISLVTGLDPRPATIDLGSGAMARNAVQRLLHRLDLNNRNDAFVQIQVQPTLVEPGYGVRDNWLSQ